jgi:hypothetical protein
MTSRNKSKKEGSRERSSLHKSKKEGSRERSSLHKSKKEGIAIKTNPKLWEKVKEEVTNSSKGGVSGKWSARKAQLAVKLYKERGGRYKGSRSRSNSLTKWSDEKWGYVGKEKHSRYLPEVVRSHLSSRSRRSESRKKTTRYGEWVPYGEEVKSLMHKYKIIKRSQRSRSRSRSKK